VPIIHDAKIVSLTEYGDASLEFQVAYEGGFNIELETEAKIEVVAARPMKVVLVLAVVIQSLHGKVGNMSKVISSSC
jgi:hypothetical protein